jgi:DNA-binding NarL/FixJ family response regulator
MADEADRDDTNESEYVRELNARHARFLALGGNIDLQTEMKGFTPLKDLVTDQHRKIVFDLCAAGLSNEAVAAVMGISKETPPGAVPYRDQHRIRAVHG